MAGKEYKMKKKDKISLLIFKKADNTINKKELKKLNKYLEKNSDLKEEYVLIENIRKELKNCSDSPLPSDFKVKLREKLVDYNLNNTPIKSKNNLFKLNITATAVLAIFLIAFSFGTNYHNSYNTLEKETQSSYNLKASQPTQDINNNLEDVNISAKQRIMTEDKSRTVNSSVDSNKNIADTHKEITPYEVAKENAPIENEAVAIEENVSSGASAGGGGGSSMATSPIYDYSHSVDNIVIITNCDNSLFNDIKMEEVEKNIFKIDIKEYSNIINILNDIPYEIKNFSEENSFKPYFYIVNEK